MTEPDARFGWRKFECRLVNATVGLKRYRRGDPVVLIRDWGGARSGDDAVLVCSGSGEPLGHLPAKCAGVIGEALDHGELYQGKLQNVGEENGRVVAYAGFNRAEDVDDVRAITKMLKRSNHAWAKFRIKERSQSPGPSPVVTVTVVEKGPQRIPKKQHGCVGTVLWAAFFVVVIVIGIMVVVVLATNP